MLFIVHGQFIRSPNTWQICVHFPPWNVSLLIEADSLLIVMLLFLKVSDLYVCLSLLLCSACSMLSCNLRGRAHCRRNFLYLRRNYLVLEDVNWCCKSQIHTDERQCACGVCACVCASNHFSRGAGSNVPQCLLPSQTCSKARGD